MRARVLVAACIAAVVAAPLAPTTAQAASPNRTVKVDVDGDHHKDTVKLYEDDTSTLVKVTTAKKKHASKRTRGGELGNGYYAAAKVDGTKGYELIFVIDQEMSTQYQVLTWRKNKLVNDPAPYILNADGKKVSWSPGDEDLSGFRFFTSKGKRYVDATYLWFGEDTYEGVTYRSVWKSGAWSHKSDKSIYSLTEDEAAAYSGFHGLKLIKK